MFKKFDSRRPWVVRIMQAKGFPIAVVLAVVCLSLDIKTTSSQTIFVETKYGKILGNSHYFSEEKGPIKTVNTFLGVPYALPPINSLRFRPPQPPKTWKPRIYNATFFRNVCPQKRYSYFLNSIRLVWPEFSWEKDSSEDCLYANIFSPGKNAGNSSGLYPVIMFIHGGSNILGTSARHTTPGEVLPRWGIVLVTIQYRLGPFGFMTTGDSAARGNYGLLDQVQALKWIQENIGAFGGDRSKVTILGVSSGGASVGLHLLSPLSRGLFHQAIAESGVEFSPFAFRSVDEAVQRTKDAAKKLGCSTENHEAMIKCLQAQNPDKIIDNYDFSPYIGPVIDNYFIYDTPGTLRKHGNFSKVPLIAGFNSDEGAHNTPAKYIPPAQITLPVFRNSIKDFVKEQVFHSDKMTAGLIEAAVEFQYTPWDQTIDSPTLRQKIVDMQSDYYVAAPTVEVLRLHSLQAPAYMYEFSHKSKLSTNAEWRGIQHGENTPYCFGAPFLNITSLNFNEEDKNVSRLIMSAYANFAREGTPTPHSVQGVTWSQFNATHWSYLRILPNPEMKSNFEPYRMAFWNSYYPKLVNFSRSVTQSSGWEKNRGAHNAVCKRFPNRIVIVLLVFLTIFI